MSERPGSQPAVVERRGTVRYSVNGRVLWNQDGVQRRCGLHDLSWTGAGIGDPGVSVHAGDRLVVSLVVQGRLLGTALAEVIHRAPPDRVGLRFVQINEGLAHELEDLFAELALRT